MNYACAILILGILTGLHQLRPSTKTADQVATRELTWPRHFDGELLIPLKMTKVEKKFQRGFPGRIASFSCGDRQIILRHITRASRKLHPSADCLRASGHHIGPIHVHADESHRHWSGFTAEKSGKKYRVLERITDPQGHAWTDTSAWYWHALLHPNDGPWQAQTLIEEHP